MQFLNEHSSNNVLVVKSLVSAIMDPLTVGSVLRELLQKQEESGQSNVVLDLSNVQMMSTGMLGALLTFRSMGLSRNISLKLCGLNGPLEQVFAATTLTGLFDVYQTEQDALSSFEDETAFAA